MTHGAKEEYVLRPVEGGADAIRFALHAPHRVELADGSTLPLKILRREENGFTTLLFGERVIHGFIERHNGELTLTIEGRAQKFSLQPAALDSMRQGMLKASAQNGSIELRSPIPGLIKAVRVELNAGVTAGQTLAILEAMKMENEIRAPHSGIVEKISVAAGQNVAAGAVMFAIKTNGAS
ncbi:MAG TPA: biotin/lipoyl-containing protein [Planctomycetota bacterium]|nr:biotin/lipoyl-containing protein [Planctomycetota bacterium]